MIGVTITTLLKANLALMALVPADRIFPYVANEKIPLPLIVYRVDSLVPEYTKDGWADDDCTFTVISACNDYMTLQLIVAQIRIALECKRDSSTGRITMLSQKEGFNIQEAVFQNELTFKTEIVTI